jgi:hypothetical protein
MIEGGKPGDNAAASPTRSYCCYCVGYEVVIWFNSCAVHLFGSFRFEFDLREILQFECT